MRKRKTRRLKMLINWNISSRTKDNTTGHTINVYFHYRCTYARPVIRNSRILRLNYPSFCCCCCCECNMRMKKVAIFIIPLYPCLHIYIFTTYIQKNDVKSLWIVGSMMLEYWTNYCLIMILWCCFLAINFLEDQ